MNESDEKLHGLVKRSLGPMADTELKRDLWPRIEARLEAPAARVPWWDWALAGAVALSLLLFPAAIPAVLYQL
jgi:hypothetical protein